MLHILNAMTSLDYYLVIATIVGFIAATINHLLYKHTESKQIDKVITIIALAGGSLGILISVLIFERKLEKGVMMSRVFLATVLVMQILIIILLKTGKFSNINLAFWKYFADHKWLLIYIGVLSLITFILFGIDKYKAVKNRFRIPIVVLLGFSFVGGALGGIIGMYTFRHKTKKDYFTIGLPLMLAMHIVIIIFLMNIGGENIEPLMV